MASYIIIIIGAIIYYVIKYLINKSLEQSNDGQKQWQEYEDENEEYQEYKGYSSHDSYDEGELSDNVEEEPPVRSKYQSIKKVKVIESRVPEEGLPDSILLSKDALEQEYKWDIESVDDTSQSEDSVFADEELQQAIVMKEILDAPMFFQMFPFQNKKYFKR